MADQAVNPDELPFTTDQAKECAMLVLTQDEAATRLKVPLDQFLAIMERPEYAEAWERGRTIITTSLHADVLQASKAGNVAAMRLLKQLIDRQGSFIKPISQPPKPSHDAIDSEFRSQLTGGNAE